MVTRCRNNVHGHSGKVTCTCTSSVVLTFNDLDLNCSRGDYVQLLPSQSTGYDSTCYNPITLCSSPTKLKIIGNEMMNLVRKVSETAHQNGIVYDNQQFANNITTNGQRKLQRRFQVNYRCMIMIEISVNRMLLLKNRSEMFDVNYLQR